METTEHLLFLCKWTKRVWQDPIFEQIRPNNSINRTDQWLLTAFRRDQNLPARELISLILWNIWKARNNRIFRAKEPQPADLLLIAKEQQYTLSTGRSTKGERALNQNSPTHWRPPEGQNLKLNVDASWRPGDFLCSVAGIARDAAGRVLDGFAATTRVSSAAEAETQAILHGISFLHELKPNHVRDLGSPSGSYFIESAFSLR
ncbi:uncharacterized protein LOC120291564 [Eucalyptus grandis]|uniref:uncharacterized protein LOC120291564 n=1 Tax=Eucalyptus grandis TaxID=71139 RepID=UPI00192EA6D2|nr:uncharacterized protein LOC120291564 [Eucalyptus grandis]